MPPKSSVACEWNGELIALAGNGDETAIVLNLTRYFGWLFHDGVVFMERQHFNTALASNRCYQVFNRAHQ